MEIKINHVYGNQEVFDLQIVKLSLNGDISDSEALNSGWLIYNNKWYSCRSSRINTDLFHKPPKEIKGYSFEYKDSFEVNEEVLRVYNKHSEVRGFTQKYDLTVDLARSSGIFVYKEGVLVAFTKFIKYENALESQFTSWDYSEPKASIGKHIVNYEVDVSKKLNYKYLYIGPVYGLQSKYKTNFDGFEWWTGSEWSTNKDVLMDYLSRDSSTKTLEDLNEAFFQTT